VEQLGDAIKYVLRFVDGENIDRGRWEQGRYCPTPTIIEAAMALYAGHSVAEISRSDACATNLTQTSQAISEIIRDSKKRSRKSICFLTRVPEAGKTLVGLNIANKHMDRKNELYSVFLSGNGPLVVYRDELHLSVSMRSFRAEHVSLLVKQLLDLDKDAARATRKKVSAKYPIAITRDLSKAKKFLRKHARGSERYGIVASSQAERLKPHAIDAKSPMDPIHWFLDDKEDVRSSYYLEDVATEFRVQGLELDWACVTWDADFRYTPTGWEHRSFVGSKRNGGRDSRR
jgi:hypothetical protein